MAAVMQQPYQDSPERVSFRLRRAIGDHCWALDLDRDETYRCTSYTLELYNRYLATEEQALETGQILAQRLHDQRKRGENHVDTN